MADLKTAILDAVTRANPTELLPPDLPPVARTAALAAWPMASTYLRNALAPVDPAQLEAFVTKTLEKAGAAAGYRITMEPLTPPQLLAPGEPDPRD